MLRMAGKRRAEMVRDGRAMVVIFRCGEWLDLTVAPEVSFERKIGDWGMKSSWMCGGEVYSSSVVMVSCPARKIS